jgi:hypothetical protein
MKKRFAALALLLHSFIAYGEDASRDVREIRLAEESIFWALVGSVSEEGRRACSQSPLVCGDTAGELGLALLAEKSSADSRQVFASLLKYRLDGGLSEDYTCYALQMKGQVLPRLKELDAVALEADCEARFERAKVIRPRLMQGVEIGHVCSRNSVIRQRAGELAEGIERGAVCALSDF